MIWHPFTPQVENNLPLKIVSAHREFLYDENNKAYIDGIASWWTVIHGHTHPRIIEAIRQQAEKLDHVLLAGFTHESAEILAQKLLTLTAPTFSRVMYSDNGSTAVEIMLKLAHQFHHNRGDTTRKIFVCFSANYHGDTVGAMSIGGESVFNRVFSKLLFDVARFDYPQSEDDAVFASLESWLNEHHERVSGIILEPLIAAAGGMIFQTTGALQRLDALAKKYGLLLLLDEVFTGMGRIGSWFAYQAAHVEPDMIALAKGLTGGSLALSATLISKKIHSAFVSDDPAKTFYHGHTMSGNPIACAAALASLELFDEENRFAEIAQLETSMRSSLSYLLQKHSHCIASTRVKGAVGVVELLTDSAGYVNRLGKQVREACLVRGVVLRPLGNIVYITPPFNIASSSLEKIFSVLDEVLGLL